MRVSLSRGGKEAAGGAARELLPGGRPSLLTLFLVVGFLLGGERPAVAQDLQDAPGDGAVLAAAPFAAQEAGDAEPSPLVSPGGAFLRSLAVPGWGHAATGSYTRAGFYFTTSGATLWMVAKTAQSLGAARDHLSLVEGELEEEAIRAGITDPDSVAARLGADERVTGMRSLVESREQQMEDWTAFGIFWLLLNATDAFVSAHLADFPDPVEVDVVPGSPGRPSELRFSIPVGGFGR